MHVRQQLSCMLLKTELAGIARLAGLDIRFAATLVQRPEHFTCMVQLKHARLWKMEGGRFQSTLS